MSTIIRSALIALVLTGATASIAAPRTPDLSKPYAGYDPDSTQGARAFWEYQSQHHGS
jgi:hypothetical protein